MKKAKSLLAFLLCMIMTFSAVACVTDTNSHKHKGVHRTGKDATCTTLGKLEHWQCVICDKLFLEEACENEIDTFVAPKKAHTLVHHPEVLATETEDGNIEHWTCSVCGNYFSDEQGKSQISEKDIVIGSFVTLVDFIVDVPEDRDAIVLQLADPQLMDSAHMRTPDRLGKTAAEYWNTDSRKELCYDLISEVVTKTNPDLILLSGDIIYGSFDDDGHMLLEFVEFMETLDIPWAPIMGNHDVESNKGADWMCAQYENAQNCLFKQGDVEGNGNYTIGIKQGGTLKRVFFNVDTNGCTNASTASKTNGHTVTRENNDYGKDIGVYGLQQDQIKWITETVNGINSFVENVKFSLHMHIAMKYFAVAFNEAYKDITGNDPVAQIVVSQTEYTAKGRVLYPDRYVGHKEGDFGYLTTLDGWTPDYWDVAGTNDQIPGATGDHAIYKQIKALGFDSIFVGHMHSMNASIVYDGIRFQFGQKCSLFDSVPVLLSNNEVISGVGYSLNPGAVPLIGGTVIPVDNMTGKILTPFTQYCENYGAKKDWSSLKNTLSKAS